jgi:hypothetical protein
MLIPEKWRLDYLLWVETFAVLNLAFLALDILIAHSSNDFRRVEEYIPLYFSIAAAPLLLVALLSRQRWGKVWTWTGLLVGWTSIAVGLAGVLFHLQSHFFYERTLKSLTYAAPFAAPLAYAGIGLLLVMDRMIDAKSREWAFWVLFLALGGFAGNFVLSLTDHAVNGFYRPAEWIPVVSSAFAVGFLLTLFLTHATSRYLAVCAFILLIQAGVGVAGFVLHAAANLKGPAASIFQNVIDGAPPLAPLLFPNLVVLALIGLWVLSKAEIR